MRVCMCNRTGVRIPWKHGYADRNSYRVIVTLWKVRC